MTPRLFSLIETLVDYAFTVALVYTGLLIMRWLSRSEQRAEGRPDKTGNQPSPGTPFPDYGMQVTIIVWVFTLGLFVSLVALAPRPELKPRAELPLWVAWKYWLLGAELDKFLWYGHSIRFWGRLGKVSEYLAGAAIIVDLIGVGKIRYRLIHTSEALKSVKEKELVFRWWASAWMLSIFVWGVLNSIPTVPNIALEAILVFAVILFYGAVALSITVLSIPVLVWLLDPSRANRATRLVSVMLLSFGIYFDLLAS